MLKLKFYLFPEVDLNFKVHQDTHFRISVYFIFLEAVFISEQIVEFRYGTLLEVTDTLSSKLNVFICMILQC